jgi:serine protease AprX
MRARRSTRVTALGGLVASVLTSLAAPATAGATGAAGATEATVVVRAADAAAAAAAVDASGGTVELVLAPLDAVVAEVTPVALARLQRAGVAVVADTTVTLTADGFTPATTEPELQVRALNPGLTWGADAGDGVGVALVDTGVVDTPDLAGRVVRGPDFTAEGDGIDRYGHGTFMAGLIAGRGARVTGVAGGAHVVSVKVAGRDGAARLVDVMSGIAWVIEHADQHDIGVLSLSLGVDWNVPVQHDPLAWAVEAAWASGITVVVAAGNDGRGEVTSPGRDPWVVTVGATDMAGTASTGDDTVPEWSGGRAARRASKPEVVAPGVGVVSVRVPGSTIDESFPGARIDETYFRGSGTSMSAALTAGAAATLLQRHPRATPDDIKAALIAAADPIPSGRRAVDLDGADRAEPSSDWWQRHPLAFSRFGDREIGMPWTGATWTGATWTGATWTGARWTGATWTGARWTGARWTGATWTGATWTGARWTGATWTGATWTGARWTGATWTGARWTATGWDDASGSHAAP